MDANIEVSYDIFEWFPVLVCQNVFKYLNNKDLVQASAVNKEWNKFCDESPKVETFKLLFSAENLYGLTDEVVELIKNSKRRYRNIEFRNISSRHVDPFNRDPTACLLKILEDRAGSWKSVNVNFCDRFNEGTWRDILRIIEPSVEKLTIYQINILAQPKRVNPNWTFPSLKFLEFSMLHIHSILKYLSRCTTLVKLQWANRIKLDLFVERSLLTLLHNNRNLKEIRTNRIDILADHSFEFRLRKLHLEDKSNGLQKLYSLLEAHAETLESLRNDVMIDTNCSNLILSMRRLKSLMTNFKTKAAFEMKFSLNTTLNSLDISSFDLSQFETLFKSFPNLKHLKCHDLNEKVLLLLMRWAPALESLEVEHCELVNIPVGEIFPKMKKLEVQYFCRTSKMPTGESNFETMLRRQMKNSTRFLNYKNLRVWPIYPTFYDVNHFLPLS